MIHLIEILMQYYDLDFEIARSYAEQIANNDEVELATEYLNKWIPYSDFISKFIEKGDVYNGE